MTHHPFALLAASWEAGLVSGLAAEFRIFDPAQYAAGDLSVSRDADGDIVGPEFALHLNMSRKPVALELALVDLVDQDFDTTYFGSVFVVPSTQREVIELASPLRIVLAADAEASLRTDDPLSVFVRARRVAEEHGAELVLGKNRRGESTVRIERSLTSSDIAYTVTGSDPASYRYPNKQVDDFVRTIQQVILALRPIGPAPKSAGACYLATAVYGSYDAPQVVSLRQFRDERLSASALGRAFVRWYYAVSPRLAKHLAGASAVNRSAKVVLDALVRVVENRNQSNHLPR